MENQRTGFANYLANLTACSPVPRATQRVAAIVMNANPFTLGHLYLVEKAASEMIWYIFLLCLKIKVWFRLQFENNW
ncbi:[citrate [pro-3S]-lyase] ligase [Actinobacillus equuli]|nr:[citrate [pro-3S]-lyase] ligase [Actinobacillus equuli]